MDEKLQYIQARIIQLRQFLLTTDPVVSIQMAGAGGRSVTYDRKQVMEELKELERQEKAIQNPNYRITNIDIRSSF